MIQSELPKSMWVYGIKMAAYIRNRCFNNRLNSTAIEALTGKQPDLSKLEIFGSKCFMYEQNKSKLDDRCVSGVFVGFDQSSPSYLVYVNGHVRKARCVKFVRENPKDFKNVQNAFKLEKCNNNRTKLLIAQRRYRREINLQKRLKKENDIKILVKIEKSNPKLFWKTVKNMINSKATKDPDIISNQQWVDHFHSLLNKKPKDNQFLEYINASLPVLEKEPIKDNKILNQEITARGVTRYFQVVQLWCYLNIILWCDTLG